MSSLKITMVGGGSLNWTPRLVSNILSTPYLDGSRVVLYDLDPEVLELAHKLCLKYGDLAGSSVSFEQTTDRAAAFDGADAVVVTISTGGLSAMRADLEIPEKYGIYQTVGDTTGPGGLSRALRNIPVFLDMAQAMDRHCPDAWMLNCSNPLSVLTQVVCRETGIRALGVCHGVVGDARVFARFFDVPLSDCAYVNTGLDHCAWFTDFAVEGRPATERLAEMGIDDWIGLPPGQARDDEVFSPLYTLRCGLMLGRRFGVLPAIGDRHIVEFMRGFLCGEGSAEGYGLVRTSIAERETRASEARTRAQGLLDGSEKLRLLGSSDDVGGWIAALNGGPVKDDNVSAPNTGQIPQLPDGVVVETRGILDAAGCHPLVSPMPEVLASVVAPHALRESLVLEAALEGSFEKALAAMTADPLVARPETARPMLEELIAATADWLPQF